MRAEGSGSPGVSLDRPASTPARYAVLAAWLILVVVSLWVLKGARLSTDMSAFLPSNPDEHQRLLVDQIKDGALSRMVLMGIEGGDSATRAATCGT